MCTDINQIYKRAAGRRSYNSIRKFNAALRRRQISQMVRSGACGAIGEPGTQTRIANALGVHRSTICRDLQTLLEETRTKPCPFCGSIKHIKDEKYDD